MFSGYWLTGGEDCGDDSASLWPSDGLQSDCVLCGGSQLRHAVKGCRGAKDNLLSQEKKTRTISVQHRIGIGPCI